MTAQLPQFTHILETILYTRNLDKARDFYGGQLQLTPIPGMSSPRGQGYQLGHTNLLILTLGETTDDLVLDTSTPEHKIPKHGPSEHILDLLLDGDESNILRQHYCLATNTVDEAKQWEHYLTEQDVPVTGRMQWQQGGYSVYFNDPDGHVGEIASRGLWPNWK